MDFFLNVKDRVDLISIPKIEYVQTWEHGRLFNILCKTSNVNVYKNRVEMQTRVIKTTTQHGMLWSPFNYSTMTMSFVSLVTILYFNDNHKLH